MIRGLILDGWHKGELVTMPQPLPVFRLLKERRLLCYEDDGCFDPVYEPEGVCEYKLAAVDLNGELALYSERGDLLAPMTTGRTWIYNVGFGAAIRVGE